jgi:4-amino-4-deoxy-L-arabinose transferase-like glycosyltransferase
MTNSEHHFGEKIKYGILVQMIQRRFPIFWFVLVLIIVAGVSLVIYATQWGPWAIEDTVDYFDAARNFTAGRGLTHTRASGRIEPMHIHPPFYSMVLGLLSYVLDDMMSLARTLNILLFALTIITLGWGVKRLTGRPIAAVSVSLFLAFSTVMVNNYSGAMSEGLYFFLGITSLVILTAYLQSGKRLHLLIAGLLTGLAFMTRFTGASFIAAGCVALLIWHPGVEYRYKYRLIDSVLFGLLGVLFYLGWFLYLRLGFPGVNPGYYDWNVINFWEAIAPMRGALIDGMYEWLGGNLLPINPSYLLRLGLSSGFFVIFSTLLVLAVRQRKLDEDRTWFRNATLQLSLLFASIAFFTAVILILSYAFVIIPKPALYARITSPIQFGIILAFLFGLDFIAQSWTQIKWSSLLPLGFLIILLLVNLPRTIDLVKDFHINGYYYTSWEWRESAAIAEVDRMNPDIPLISNQPAPIFFYTGRPVYDLTSSLNQAGANQQGVRYGDNLEDPAQVIFRERGAALIIFDKTIEAQLNWIYAGGSANDVLDPLDMLTEGLIIYVVIPDGVIYFYPSEP